MTLEAVMLHYLDDMDAKINGIKQFLKTQVPEGSKWSTYHRSFERVFYFPDLLEETELTNNIVKNESGRVIIQLSIFLTKCIFIIILRLVKSNIDGVLRISIFA